MVLSKLLRSEVLLPVLAVGLVACGGAPVSTTDAATQDAAGCMPGVVDPCTCDDGRVSARLCTTEHVFTACVCGPIATPDGGAPDASDARVDAAGGDVTTADVRPEASVSVPDATFDAVVAPDATPSPDAGADVPEAAAPDAVADAVTALPDVPVAPDVQTVVDVVVPPDVPPTVDVVVAPPDVTALPDVVVPDVVDAAVADTAVPLECTPGTMSGCYSGAAATSGVGRCHGGARFCNALGMYLPACFGEVLPNATEICGNAVDDDCNGATDEGCTVDAGTDVLDAASDVIDATVIDAPPSDASVVDVVDAAAVDSGCAAGAMQACYSGLASTVAVGRCHAGIATCSGGTYGACTGEVTPAASETCGNNVDDDCNGATDENCCTAVCNGGCVDPTSDTANCGGCNLACGPYAHATPACRSSACAVGTCTTGYGDCNHTVGDGCETDLSTSTPNCGACGAPCGALEHANVACSGSRCVIGSCAPGYTDCNGVSSDGCEADTADDATQCGGCHTDCTTLLAYTTSTTCSLGSCHVGTCVAGHYDANGIGSDGCESTCNPATPDLPDDFGSDPNCDGVDGTVTDSIFVAADGSDANAGTTTASPMATVQAAVTRAQSLGRHAVLVSEGTYSGTVTLVAGISVYGGYSRSHNWNRGPRSLYLASIGSDLATSARIVGVECNGVTTATTVDNVAIYAGTGVTVAAGVSTYGLHAVGCTALTVRRSAITAGAAGAGTPGVDGTAGAAGGAGGNAGPTFSCGSGEGAGGTAGASSCGRPGGVGGRGSWAGGAGHAGTYGTYATPGGAGGAAPGPTGAGYAGGNGSNGAAGGIGLDGDGGSNGAVVADYWVGADGGAGTPGGDANGGGGGGGSSGLQDLRSNNTGSSGGGGGAGGCGGTLGTVGRAGGSSFGVFASASSGLVLSGNVVTSAAAGAGGRGGTGGVGGGGGIGGRGAAACSAINEPGGNGGTGGTAGRGGHGGGAAGGLSYAVYRVNTTVDTATDTLAHGAAGAGGASSGNAGVGGTADYVN